MASPHLNKLPAELRNVIYRMVLVFDEPLRVGCGSDCVLKRTALQQTCTQIRAEASGISFGNDCHITCGAGNGQAGAAWLKLMKGNGQRLGKIIIDVQVATATLDHLSVAEERTLEYQVNDEDGITDSDVGTALCEEVTEPIFNNLTKDALNLAQEISSGIRSSTSLVERVQVLAPEVERYRPDVWTGENCLHDPERREPDLLR